MRANEREERKWETTRRGRRTFATSGEPEARETPDGSKDLGLEDGLDATGARVGLEKLDSGPPRDDNLLALGEARKGADDGVPYALRRRDRKVDEVRARGGSSVGRHRDESKGELVVEGERREDAGLRLTSKRRPLASALGRAGLNALSTCLLTTSPPTTTCPRPGRVSASFKHRSSSRADGHFRRERTGHLPAG